MTKRPSERTRNVAIVLFGLLGASACSSGNNSGSSGDAGGGSPGSPVTTDAQQVGCDKPTQTYVPGMSQKGTSGALTFEIVQVNGDAIAVGVDTWTVKLLDGSGQPVLGATFPTIKAWMPEHTHGWTQAVATEVGGGEYTISNLYLFMAGYWQITLDAQAGAVTDSTVFSFCLGDSN